MIVACPKCHKRYRLDSKGVNYVQMPGNIGLGVQLVCANCNEYWWETKSVETSQEGHIALFIGNYQDLTDISNLFIHSNKPYIRKKLNIKKNRQLGSGLDNKKIDLKYIVITIVCFIALLSSGIFILFLENNESHGTEIEKTSTETEQKQLVVKKIQYQVQDSNNTRSIIVNGEIINPNTFSIPIPKVSILVYGKCESNAENADTEKEDENKCLITKWVYKWKNKELAPGKTHLETSYPMSLEAEILTVDVDID